MSDPTAVHASPPTLHDVIGADAAPAVGRHTGPYSREVEQLQPEPLAPLQPATGPVVVKPTLWGVVEVMGHVRIAGALSDHTLAGAHYLRVDVPEVSFEQVQGVAERTRRSIPAHTYLLRPVAIFGVQPCDEATAVLLAHQYRREPVRQVELRQALRQLSSGDVRQLLEDATATADTDDERPF